MCNNTGDAKQWGSKCTIDAKKLWKIFFITPGDGMTNVKVCWARVLCLTRGNDLAAQAVDQALHGGSS
jgi:hypothetical protein